MKAATGSGFLHITLAKPDALDAAGQLLESQLGRSVQRSVEGAELSLTAPSPQAANAAVAALLAAGFDLAGFSMGSPSLDEVFFALTGERAPEDTQEETTP